MVFIKKRSHIKYMLLISIILLIVLMVLSATFGVADISFVNAVKILSRKLPLIGEFISSAGIDETHARIIVDLRLPRILLSALVGAGLAVVGAALQGMFKNPMADPYVLGISSGASLGATIALVVGGSYSFLGVGIITVFAFFGSVLTALCVYNIAKVGNKIPTITLLLSGIAVSFMLSAMVSIIMIFNRSHVEKIIFWTMGSVSAASWNQVGFLLPIILISVCTIISFSRDLNVMSTGEETAKSLGIEVEKVKKSIIFMCSVMVAACVSVSGVIGFVGLIVPHSIRLIVGYDHRVVLPFSAVGGAAFMVICDTIARSAVPPVEIPVGVITSIFGAPYFIYLLYKSKKKVF
ncbi:MAG: iron ABC transporter permease [Clostridiaceae bacterium]|nr:iron ABC transporter permease [Clostridiaceae bacterium]